MVQVTSVNSLALIFNKINLSLSWKLTFWKSYHSRPSKISNAHISVVGNPWTTIFYHIIIRPILNMFLKTFYMYYKKDTTVGGVNLGYQLWFCTRLLRDVSVLFITSSISTGCEIASVEMLWILGNEKFTLGQVMAWSLHAKSLYLATCWLRSMLPGGVSRPQCDAYVSVI